MSETEILIGHKEIREFIDPDMGKSYYFAKIVPKIKDIFIERSYVPWGKPKITTYKHLLIARLLEIKTL
jgi:hypothetical protein